MKKSNEENPSELSSTAKEEGKGCCGGPPVANEDACCVKDEKAKAAGAEGCGCATPAPAPAPAPTKSCCP